MTYPTAISLLGCLGCITALTAVAADSDVTVRSFKKIQVSDQFWAEGANFGDFNKDGVMDVVSGPYWWEGPDYKKRHEYAPATQTFRLKVGAMTEVNVPGFEGGLGKNNAYSKNSVHPSAFTS